MLSSSKLHRHWFQLWMKKRDKPFGLHENNFRQEFENNYLVQRNHCLSSQIEDKWKEQSFDWQFTFVFIVRKRPSKRPSSVSVSTSKGSSTIFWSVLSCSTRPLANSISESCIKRKQQSMSIVNNFGDPQPSMTAKVLACAKSALPIL